MPGAGEGEGAHLFDAEQNQNITWDHLLRQTSDWQGTLWGKPDWADRPEGRAAGGLAEPPAARAGHTLQVQRRAHQRARSRGPAGAAKAAARGAARGVDGSDWRLEHLALAWLRELVGGSRRPARAVGVRRRPLGRRHVHQRVRHGALRLSLPEERQVEGSPARVGEVDRDGAHARTGERDLRLRQPVPEYQARPAAGGAGLGGVLRRQRQQLHLHRLGERPDGGHTVGGHDAQPQRDGREAHRRRDVLRRQQHRGDRSLEPGA